MIQDKGERAYAGELRALMRITLIPPSSGQDGVVLARKIAADAIGIAKTEPPAAEGEMTQRPWYETDAHRDLSRIIPDMEGKIAEAEVKFAHCLPAHLFSPLKASITELRVLRHELASRTTETGPSDATLRMAKTLGCEWQAEEKWPLATEAIAQLTEALQLIEDGEGDADVIARQTLAQLSIPTRAALNAGDAK